jgi:hypothetical protein
MIASHTPNRFWARMLLALVVCAAAAVWAGCEPKRASRTYRAERYDLGSGSRIPDRAANAIAGDSSNRKPALCDPRNDPVTREWAMRQLRSGHWRDEYAQLVEVAAQAPRIACHGGSRLGAGDRAAADGVRGAQREEPVDTLVADLLGATLVDAQDELWTAWRALERAGFPEPARTLLSEPPPWPPASIEKYLRREGENSMSLIETLATELTPAAAVRTWLVRSWLSRPRAVDQTLLGELASAADGRLYAEPRLRAWLRAEWTASARQRYRRVTRLAVNSQPHSLPAERSRLIP